MPSFRTVYRLCRLVVWTIHLIVGLGLPTTAHLMFKVAPFTTVATAPLDFLESRTWSLNRDVTPRQYLGISGGATVEMGRRI